MTGISKKQKPDWLAFWQESTVAEIWQVQSGAFGCYMRHLTQKSIFQLQMHLTWGLLECVCVTQSSDQNLQYEYLITRIHTDELTQYDWSVTRFPAPEGPASTPALASWISAEDRKKKKPSTTRLNNNDEDVYFSIAIVSHRQQQH